MLPGPKSVPTNSVLSSTQAVLVFASGILNPSLTNRFVVRSNSRVSVASDPPRDSETMQRLYSGSKQSAPLHDQVTPSALSRSTCAASSHSRSARTDEHTSELQSRPHL